MTDTEINRLLAELCGVEVQSVMLMGEPYLRIRDAWKIWQHQQQRIDALEAAFCAAREYIDSHVGDPDVTPKILEKYSNYLLAKCNVENTAPPAPRDSLGEATQAELVEQALLDLGYIITRDDSGIIFAKGYDHTAPRLARVATNPAERRRALCEFAAKVKKEKA